MARSASYVLRRGDTYSLRLRLPHDLAIRIGRADVVRALGTDRPGVARLIAAGIAIRVEQLWASLRMDELGAGITEALDAWLKDEIDREWKRFQLQAPHRSGGERALVENDAEQQLQLLQDGFHAGDCSSGQSGADQIAAALSEPLDRDAHAFAVLAGRVMEALGGVQEARLRWARGDVAYRPVMPSSMPPAPTPDDRVVPALGELAEDYLRHRQKEQGTSDKGIGQARSQIGILLHELSPEMRVTDVTPEMAGAIFDALRDLPANYRKHPDLHELSPIKAAVVARATGLTAMSNQTINNYASAIRGVFEEAITRKVIKENPFSDLWVKAKKQAGSKRGFRVQEVEAILSAPVFMGCERSGRPFQPGRFLLNDWRFWLPIVAMLTGARINELCQLRREDVAEHDGVLAFNIVADDGKRLKTEQSERVVPVHDELIRLGFMRYVETRPLRAAVGSLFDIPCPTNGDWGAKAGNWFREKLLVNVLGEEKREGIGFHSFRHKAETDMRGAGVREDVSNRLLGHKIANVAAGYGRYEAQPAKDSILKIKLPAILMHIPSRQ